MNIEKQIDYLKNFITEKRFKRFQEVLQERTRYITIVLEDVFQGHNASAVLRSCDCFGLQDVHVIENRNEFKPNEEVSMGAAQWLTIHRYKEKEKNNTERCYQWLKQKGYKIIATSPHYQSVSIKELQLDKPLAIVFGAEKEGLSDYALKKADVHVYIPMYGFTESFNISVSAALCMYELTARLRSSDIDYHLSNDEKNRLLLEWLKESIKDADKILERMPG
ncbi:MAG: TrmH family RNA methyltransferase [Bacteroidetes bacterium]|nr:MAG: TrmH family RNA methyltransferase [Bacteroidota bacterium]